MKKEIMYNNVIEFITTNKLDYNIIEIGDYENYRRIFLEDSYGYKYSINYENFIKGKKPYLVHKTNKYSEYNIKLFVNKNYLEYTYIGMYRSKKRNIISVILKCNKCGKIFHPKWADVLAKNITHHCFRKFNEDNLIIKTNKELVEEWDYDKNHDIDINLITRGSNKRVYWICKKCKNSYRSMVLDRAKGHGCPFCKVKRQTGKNSILWKNGEYSLYDYCRKRLFLWKKKSLEYYNNVSIISGEKESLEIHHCNISFLDILNKTLDLCNIELKEYYGEYTQEELEQIVDTLIKLHFESGYGVPLTNQEHILFHKMYGHKNNTNIQFVEFVIDFYKKEYDYND